VIGWEVQIQDAPARETKAIIGKAPKVGIHTWNCPLNSQVVANTTWGGI